MVGAGFLTDRTLSRSFCVPELLQADFTDAVTTGEEDRILEEVTTHGTGEILIWCTNRWLQKCRTHSNSLSFPSPFSVTSLLTLYDFKVGWKLLWEFCSYDLLTQRTVSYRYCISDKSPTQSDSNSLLRPNVQCPASSHHPANLLCSLQWIPIKSLGKGEEIESQPFSVLSDRIWQTETQGNFRSVNHMLSCKDRAHYCP